MALRKIFLPLLEAFSFDFSIKHPWVKGARIKLNSFKHKGYWYHSKNREFQTMKLFEKLISPGNHIVEVGGHIGFISIFFAELAGKRGQVTVYEPGSNNKKYIEYNILNRNEKGQAGTIELIEKAVGAQTGFAPLYEDDLTGQNNSMVRDFDILKQNEKSANKTATINVTNVQVEALDDRFKDKKVDFIKIDIEGYELQALLGARKIMERDKPTIMVEVQASRDEIWNLFSETGYLLFNDDGRRFEDADSLRYNVFALHGEQHVAKIDAIMGGS